MGTESLCSSAIASAEAALAERQAETAGAKPADRRGLAVAGSNPERTLFKSWQGRSSEQRMLVASRF